MRADNNANYQYFVVQSSSPHQYLRFVIPENYILYFGNWFLRIHVFSDHSLMVFW
jgi:hypothetical protein